MKVIIKEGIYEYVSDFDDGWQFSRGDYFKYPVGIGSNNCFIKRFEKKPEDISGWKLLDNLKEKNVPNLTRIYDVVKTNEDDRIVYYVFFEFIEGKTLHEFVAKKIGINLEKFTDDLFGALQNLHARNYWFADFCEKNIFGSKNGNFLLIDLDSVQPLSDAPQNDMWGSKEYWAFVFKFCKDILHLTEFKPSRFNGASFNYLHAIFLILRLKFFYDDDDREYDAVEFRSQLPHYLNNTSPSFKKIFESVFQNERRPLELQDISEIKSLIKEKILTLSIPVNIAGDTISPDTAPERPVINDFTVSNYVENKGDEFTIESGKTFALKWDIQNAQKAELYRNGELYKPLDNDENNIELKEESDGRERLIEYTLAAYGNDKTLELVEKISLRVKIINRVEEIIDPKPPVIKPAVIEFAINNYLKKNQDYYVVESNSPFTLTWNVNNASEIEIQQDGQHLKTVKSTEKSIEITENMPEGKEKKIRYTLSALSVDTSEVSSESINVVVKGPNPFHPVVKQFKTSKHVLRDGGSFILSWNVLNASEITLYKNGLLYKTFNGGEKNVELKENYGGIKRKIEYTLQASNTFEKAGGQPITIFVKPPVSVKMILIIAATLVALVALYFIIFSPGHQSQNHKMVFYAFTSNTIKAGDTITIMGKNLSENDKFIEIKFNDVNGKIVQLAKDEIQVQVPTLGNKPRYVNIVANIKNNVSPAVQYLTYHLAQNLLYIENIVGTQSTEFITQSKDTGQQSKDTVKQQTTKVTVMPPKIYSFSTPNVTEGETITISGENLPLKHGSIIVQFNDVPGRISKQRTKSLMVLVPALPQEINNVIISVRAGNQVLMISNSIGYQHSGPSVTVTVTPLKESVVEGNYIDIKGENLNTGNVTVKFNQVPVSIITKNPGDLRVQVPSLGDGVNKVTISVFINGREWKAADNIPYLHKN